MRCLYCDNLIDIKTLTSIYLWEDLLCPKCRKQIIKDHGYIWLDDLRVESFYLYDGMFKNLLIQYKECFDEALAPVFLYLLEDYIRYRYLGYKIVFVESSERKIQERGFKHLELMFASVKLTKVTGASLKKQLVQEGKNYEERMAMKNNYIYEGPYLDKVLIVDDVLTTGASIYGVFKALKPHSGKIKALSVAHTKTLSFHKKSDKILLEGVLNKENVRKS